LTFAIISCDLKSYTSVEGQ